MTEYISILPADLPESSTHQYLRLPHPRTGQPQLYLPYHSHRRDVILEVVKLNGSKRRTIFMGESTIDSGAILVHHPVDPLFLVMPIVLALVSSDKSSTPFQPLSDLIATAASSSTFSLAAPFSHPSSKQSASFNVDVSRLLALKSVRKVFRLCCERKVVPAAPPSPPEDGSESTKIRRTAYYKPSLERIITLVKLKVDYFADEQRHNCFDHLVRGLARDGLAGHPDYDLVKAARLKASIEHISQYLPPYITSSLLNDDRFSKLSEHLADTSAAALAAQAPPTNSNKEKAAAGTKRKAAASRGVEALKKVNTSSMSKLTSFFKPKS